MMRRMRLDEWIRLCLAQVRPVDRSMSPPGDEIDRERRRYGFDGSR